MLSRYRTRQVRPACPSTATASKCAGWPAAASHTVLVGKPAKPLLPTVQLVTPATVSGCDGLAVDGSGTQGSGGRPMWFFWSVQASPGTGANLLANLTRYINASVNPPASAIGSGASTIYGSNVLRVPREYLAAPVVYQVWLSVTNFLGYTSTVTVTVTRVAQAVPLVAIQGAPYRTIPRSATLIVLSQASLSPCSSAGTLSYRWSLTSSSSDPRVFRAAPSTLAPGRLYNLTVSVTDSLGMRSNASVQVYVQRTPLVAAIAGGDRTVGQSDGFTLDARPSFDPDGSGLKYAWSCIRGGAQFGQGCGGGLSLPNTSTPAVAGGAGGLPTGSYIFTVVVSDPPTARAATVSVTITVQADRPPTISIGALAAARVNPSAKLALTSTASPSTRPHASHACLAPDAPCRLPSPDQAGGGRVGRLLRQLVPGLGVALCHWRAGRRGAVAAAADGQARRRRDGVLAAAGAARQRAGAQDQLHPPPQRRQRRRRGRGGHPDLRHRRHPHGRVSGGGARGGDGARDGVCAHGGAVGG
jgi:hypothetical protein